jgi:flagellar protein FlaG
MVGNGFPVTADPARTSAPSVAHSERKEHEPATTGKFVALGGEPLPPPETKEPDLKQALERLNELAQEMRRDVRFRFDEESGRPIITVINASTQEVVRQIPSEEALAIARSLERNGGAIDVIV